MLSTPFLFVAAFVLGCAHAFEGDHLAAVSALVARRPDIRLAFRFGAWWALGHGLSLLCFGSILIGFRATLSLAAAAWFEKAVGLALLFLGLHLLYRLTVKNAFHVHFHGKSAVWMGMLHGIAGTAGFVAESIVLRVHGFFGAFAVTACFSAGVLISMALYSFLLGRLLADPFFSRLPAARKGIQIFVALAACAVGIARL